MSHWSIRRINALAGITGAESYLEIGLEDGHTILGVEIADRVGVDLVLRPRVELAAAGIEAHEMTSDEFFTTRLDGRRFDIVFVDGSHVFEQVVRDFLNALACLAEGGVIVLDDTWPSDVFSTLLHGRHDEQRRAHGLPATGSWHGDVFKLVFLVHDFIPALDYATVIDDGNGQTFVWRGPRARQPVLDSLEAISRLTYFDLQERADIMRFLPEAEVLEMIRNR